MCGVTEWVTISVTFRVSNFGLCNFSGKTWERHHGKCPMDGVGGTVKNVILIKVKSGKVVIYSPQEFAEAVKKFVPAIHAVYLPKSENIVEPVGIESARKIKDTLKIHKFERKVDPNGNKYINFYKISDDEEPFHVQL